MGCGGRGEGEGGGGGGGAAAAGEARGSARQRKRMHAQTRCMHIHALTACEPAQNAPASAPEALAQRALVVQEGWLEAEAVVKHGVKHAPAPPGQQGQRQVSSARSAGHCQLQFRLNSTSRRSAPGQQVTSASITQQAAPKPSHPSRSHQYRFHSSVLVSRKWRRKPGTGTFSASTPCKS